MTLTRLADYEILEELGKGTYGRVYKVRKKSTGHILVRKQVSLDGMSNEDREETLNEARVMSQCEHFNIIKYYESFIEDQTLHIVMDYAAGSDLSSKIKAQKGYSFYKN
jgi:NIMA (never in mitosis gene a)-related kinase